MYRLNGMYIQQAGHTYMIYTPVGGPVAMLFMGYDGQFAHDVTALNPITKAMAGRWCVPTKPRQNGK